MKLLQLVWVLNDLSVDQLSILLKSKYNGCEIEVIGDPAGVQRAQTNEKTCFQILLENGFNARPADSNNTTARLEAVRWWLSRLVVRTAGNAY